MNHDIHSLTGKGAHSVDLSHCRNCGAAATGNYCPACGQETVLHVPSAREFLHEFIGHYVALEGKLWGTIGLLLFRPGSLTAEYIAGRRVRHIQPLRLYLTLSVLFFALIKYSGSNADLIRSDAEVGPANVVKVAPSAPARAAGDLPRSAAPSSAKPPSAAPPSAAPPSGTSLPAPAPITGLKVEDGNVSGNISVEQTIAAINPKWAPKFSAFWHRPDTEQAQILTTAFLDYVPYAMFCMLPLFALYLKILYLGSGKRYGEHLLFALHTNAFAFVLFGAITLAPWGGVKFLLFIWLASYLPMAMRRVYGGSRKATFGRWLVLMTTHVVVMFSAILGTMLMAVVH